MAARLMCEIRTGTVNGDAKVEISSDATYTTWWASKLGPLPEGSGQHLLRLECRHLDARRPRWERVPWPKTGEYVELPPRTEIRIVGRDEGAAREFDRRYG